MKYRIFPRGYDPMVASGPCTPDLIRMGISWTEEDTITSRALAAQATIRDHKPEKGLWFEEVDETETTLIERQDHG